MNGPWHIEYKLGHYAVRRRADGYEVGVFEHFAAYTLAEKLNQMPALPESGLKLCEHEWTHQTGNIWCCENCGVFQRRAHPTPCSGDPK